MSAGGAAAGRAPLGLAGLIALAVLAVYAPVRDYPFVVYDDQALVSENPVVNGGLTRAGVVAAFARPVHGNYTPLAWVSHMLDVELFGLDAGAHHVVNALLHLASALLLLELLRRTTGEPGPSAFTALVFAIHPLHVESVAWIAERRDVLSGLFFLATLAAYAAAARARRRRGALGAAAVLLYALGLLAKPMLVTLPFVLLLLDVWPLRRAALGPRRLVLEKVPFFALAAAAATAALAAQGDAAAVVSFDLVPLGLRIENALTATVAYLGQAVAPLGLAVFYPYPEEIPLWQALAAAALLAGITAAALAGWRRLPPLAVGWLWFLGMLAPVAGLVQVGSQARADRYTYLPLVGLALAAAFAGHRLTAGRPRLRRALAAAACAWLVACGVLARTQVESWASSLALFEHARQVTGDNHVVLANLAEAHDEAGEADEALALYAASLEHFPGARRVHARMGALLAERGDVQQAAAHLRRSIALHPEETGARVELARLLLAAGRADEAAALLRDALALDPASATARFHLAEAIALLEGWRAGARGFAAALAGRGDLPAEPVLARHPLVEAALAGGLAASGHAERARRQIRRAITAARFAGETALAEELARELAAPGEAP